MAKKEIVATGLELRTIGDLEDLKCKIANLVWKGNSVEENLKANARMNVKTKNSTKQ